MKLFGHLLLRKIFKFVATRCQMLRLKCTKFNFPRRPRWGSLERFSNRLTEFKGPTSKEEEGKGWAMGGERGEERGRNREGRRGEGREEEGREGWEGRGPQVLVYTPFFQILKNTMTVKLHCRLVDLPSRLAAVVTGQWSVVSVGFYTRANHQSTSELSCIYYSLMPVKHTCLLRILHELIYSSVLSRLLVDGFGRYLPCGGWQQTAYACVWWSFFPSCILYNRKPPLTRLLSVLRAQYRPRAGQNAIRIYRNLFIFSWILIRDADYALKLYHRPMLELKLYIRRM